MSEQGDAKKLITYAESLGLTVSKEKHGGYGVYLNGLMVTSIPSNGNSRTHWQKRVRRDLQKAATSLH